MTLAAFLQRVIQILDEAGVPYMLTGSFASAYYAVPRATQDIDLVVETEAEGMEQLVRGLREAGCYVDRDAALEAWRSRGQFNAIDPESGWKVDVMVRKDRPYSQAEFARRRRASLLGVEVAIASLEDVLLAKLEWSRLGDSALQRRDVVQLLDRTWNHLDREYLERWIPELGLESEWVQARAQVPETGASGGGVT